MKVVVANSFSILLFLIFFGKSPSVASSSWLSSGFKVLKASTCFLPWSSIVFICFSNALSRREFVNFAYSIILLWSNGDTSSPVRYSYLSILLDDNADIFVACLLISCLIVVQYTFYKDS